MILKELRKYLGRKWIGAGREIAKNWERDLGKNIAETEKREDIERNWEGRYKNCGKILEGTEVDL